MHYDPEKVTFFAETDARGKRVKFGIKAKDRDRHIYVVGKTGMGKSTMLENMAIQDIQSGEGLTFIDPHGSTAEKLLDYVPESRLKDVLYFAPFDMEHPVSFNVMEDVGYDKRHLVVSGLMSTFKKIWVDAWSARMEYILSNTLLALLEYPGSTLLGVNRMLSDKIYRDLVVANVKDPSVRSFWVDEFAKYTERMAAEAVPAIQNKIGQFTANPLIRNIIGQEKSSFDVRKFMDEKKIFIVNLSKGLIGETNANLLGAMLITKIYLSAMSRADMPASELAKAPKFYFYVDEFQSFANETFASILSEARKYKLSLTIAHQYIAQMEEEVRDAVFGNVGTTITFRVGPFDAEVLETVFSPEFLATDIVNLGYTQIYLSLMIDGIGSRPFSATTLPPIEAGHVSYKDMVIAESRARFAHNRAEIEEGIRLWHEPLKKPVVEKPSVTKPTVGPAAPPPVPVRHTVPPLAPRPVMPQRESPSVAPSNPQRTEKKPTEQVAHAKQAPSHSHTFRDAAHHTKPAQASSTHKPERTHNTTTSPANDFGAILRSMVKEEKMPPPRTAYEQKKIAPPPHAKHETNKPDPKSALRSALADVLKNPPMLKIAPVVAPAPAPNISEHNHDRVHKPVQHKTEQHTDTKVHDEHDNHEDRDRKTLQKLERILRSKGNEKPPLG